MSWTPEQTVMVKAMSMAEMNARQRRKAAWSRLSIGEQAEEILTSLDRLGHGVAEKSTISLGNTARRKAISGG